MLNGRELYDFILNRHFFSLFQDNVQFSSFIPTCTHKPTIRRKPKQRNGFGGFVSTMHSDMDWHTEVMTDWGI